MGPHAERPRGIAGPRWRTHQQPVESGRRRRVRQSPLARTAAHDGGLQHLLAQRPETCPRGVRGGANRRLVQSLAFGLGHVGHGLGHVSARECARLGAARRVPYLHRRRPRRREGRDGSHHLPHAVQADAVPAAHPVPETASPYRGAPADVEEGASASAADFAVGYESVSQLTREYGRFFDASLKRNALRARPAPDDTRRVIQRAARSLTM